MSTNPPLTLISHTAMFTGLGSTETGKIDNQWRPGEPGVDKPTIFDSAQSHGFLTGYYYSKEKLGYLVNMAVSDHRFSRDNAVDNAFTAIRKPGQRFVFLHVSGLDHIGPVNGWLMLDPMIRFIREKGNYLMIITSDHAGHGTVHGSQHPDDFKLPFVIVSDKITTDRFQNMSYRVTDLKSILERLLGSNS